MNMDKIQLKKLLDELGMIYDQLGGPPLDVGICGGAGLILTGLIERTTKDIDTLFPTSWPPIFVRAVQIISQKHGLPQDWINKGPDMLTVMGLPEGFMKRAEVIKFGGGLTVYFASRHDQIFFKVYASADRGGYHVDDLLALNPTSEEMLAAGKWCRTHDLSEGFKAILLSMYEILGYGNIAKKI